VNQGRLILQARQGLCSRNQFVIKSERNAQDEAPESSYTEPSQTTEPSNEDGLGKGSKRNIQARI
jgi:hypothetical protein